jgi:pyruvate,water dikinase
MSKPAPAPDNFPITWDDPADAQLSFRQDRQHAPTPITPLTGWLGQHYWSKGATSGLAAMGQSRIMLVRRINCYYYHGSAPSTSTDQSDDTAKKAESTLDAALDVFVERWDGEWLPEIQGYHEKWNGFDLNSASDPALLEHLNWTLDTFARLWEIHFQIMMTARMGPSLLMELRADLVGDNDSIDNYKITQGVDNCSLQSGEDLWKLSQSVAESDVTKSILTGTPTSEVMATLENTAEGQRLIDGINTYLKSWGNRSDTVIEIGDPSWVEEPAILIDILKGYVQSDSENPRIRWKELVSERESAVEEILRQIAMYPEPVRNRFDTLVYAGQQGHRIQEDHNWWIDQQGNHQVRQVFREFGARLKSSGAISAQNDVFMLLGDEIIESAQNLFTTNFKSVITERRNEMEMWGKIAPPSTIGSKPKQAPDTIFSRAIGRLQGITHSQESSQGTPSGTLLGTSGSAGKIAGTARVIIKLKDAGRLKKGEILVTATTSPPWTPLFATAGGIVADTGGALSHCAIVAREYGIPATVGVRGATSTIKDGDQIEVDGDAGTVRIL